MAKNPKTQTQTTEQATEQPTQAEKGTRVRRPLRAVVKEQVGVIAASINDNDDSVRARLLKVRDLTVAQRKAAVQVILDAAQEALEAVSVEPIEGAAVTDRTADLDL